MMGSLIAPKPRAEGCHSNLPNFLYFIFRDHRTRKPMNLRLIEVPLNDS
jgi:hypothetical protein